MQTHLEPGDCAGIILHVVLRQRDALLLSSRHPRWPILGHAVYGNDFLPKDMKSCIYICRARVLTHDIEPTSVVYTPSSSGEDSRFKIRELQTLQQT